MGTLRRAAWVPFAMLLLGSMQAGASEPLRGMVEQCAAGLPAPARDALSRIEGIDRQMLALRSYVRNASSLELAWSWTNAQIAAFEGSLEQRTLNDAIDQVRHAFESANPGFTLHVNPEVRSLELQLSRWNANAGVGATSRALIEAARQWSLPRNEAAAVESFRMQLAAWRPEPPAPLAAPGLSAHGRMRAVDFQILKADSLVAGPDTSSISEDWTLPGWTRKLAAAVAESGAPFAGPLKSPEEPWHYVYSPCC